MKCILSILMLGLTFSIASQARELKVLNFNAWDLKAYGIGFSRHIKDRMKILPSKLIESKADIITLQEMWENNTKKRLAEVMEKNGYPHTYYNDGGIRLGNGLMIISKFPLKKSKVSDSYSQRTRLDEVLTKKAALHTLVEIPDFGTIDLYTTHLGAVTFNDKHDTYNGVHKEKLLNQLVQFSDWVRKTQSTFNIIVTGDFNLHYQEYAGQGHFKPEFAKDYSYLVKKLCNRGDAINTYLKANEIEITDTPHYTYTRENPYVANGHFSSSPSEVNDYIFICEFADLTLTSSQLMFTGALPDSYKEIYRLRKLPQRLSDHYGILSTFYY